MSRSQTLVFLDRSVVALRAQLAGLSENGLIADLLVISGPDEVERLSKGEYSVTSLDQELARVRLSLIRVVALRLNSAPSEQLQQFERDTLMSLIERGQQVGIAITSFTVSVVSVGHKVDPSCFHHDWTANVVVVPEESAGGEGFIAIDLTSDKVEAVGLAALTLIGGLWSWIDAGVLDHERPANVGGMTYVRLVRMSLRVVDAGDLTSRLIGWAMDPGGVWPIPNDCVVHDQPAEVIADLARSFASSDEARFVYQPFEIKNPPRQRAIGLFKAMILFYSRVWGFVRNMPYQYVERLKSRVVERVERFVQNQTFGSDSSVVIRINQRPATVAELTTTRVRAGLLTGLKEVGISTVQPTPDTWEVLRSVAFGLIDGGEFKGSLKGSEPLWLGQRAIFTERSLVAPGTGVGTGVLAFKLRALEICALGIETHADTYLRPFDVPSVDLFDARVAECLTEARENPDDAEWLPSLWRGLVRPDMIDGPIMMGDPADDDIDVYDLEEEFHDAPEDEKTAAEDSDSAPGDAGDSDAGDSDAGDSDVGDDSAEKETVEPVEQFQAAGVGSLRTPPTRDFVLTRLRERFDEWMGDRRESLMWQVGEQLHSAIDDAVEAFDTAAKDFEVIAAELEQRNHELARVNRRMRRWVLGALSVVVALLLTAVGLWVFVAAVIGYILIGSALGVVVGLPLAMYRSARELARLEFRLETLAAQPEILLERRRHASAEVSRLSNLSDQLADWSEIISSVIHRPWGNAGAMSGIDPWVAESGSHVFSLGVPEIDEVALESEVVRLRRHLARTAWLTGVYVQQEAEFTKRYTRLLAGVPGLGSRPSSDINPGLRAIGTMPHSGEKVFRPRRQFMIDVLRDRYAETMRLTQVEKLRANIDDDNTPAMLSAVSCVVQDLNGLESTQFLRPVVEQTPVPSFARFVRQRVSGPSLMPEYSVTGASEKVGAVIPDDGHERRVAVIGGVAERYVLAAFRMDISSSMELSDAVCVAAPMTEELVSPTSSPPVTDPEVDIQLG